MKEKQSILLNKLNTIPALPGVYKMLDSKGNIIYVGKSKCLKKRVKSYFVKNHKWEKVKKMVALIHDIDFIVTDTHLEARLLECNLIKTIQPYFNAQMKNDQRYIYLQVNDYNPYSILAVVNERSENTFGPFRSQHILIDFTKMLIHFYPISLKGSQYKFEYHIFPIPLAKEIFEHNQKILMDLFTSENKMNLFLLQLEDKMKESANAYHYEIASRYRDMIHSLEYVKYGINGYKELFDKKLILKIPTTEGIKLFYVNKGCILLTKKYKRLTNQYLVSFIKKGNEVEISKKLSLSEESKATIDYRDILYSEINNFTNDMIIQIDDFLEF